MSEQLEFTEQNVACHVNQLKICRKPIYQIPASLKPSPSTMRREETARGLELSLEWYIQANITGYDGDG